MSRVNPKVINLLMISMMWICMYCS